MTKPLDANPAGVKENPLPSERVYYRNTRSGDRAYLVLRNGVVMIRMDRPNEEIVRPFNDLEWRPDIDTRPLSRSAAARIAHAADRELCASMGRPREAKKLWEDLPEQVKRQRVSGVGPLKPPIRTDLYNAVWGLLMPHVRD